MINSRLNEPGTGTPVTAGIAAADKPVSAENGQEETVDQGKEG